VILAIPDVKRVALNKQTMRSGKLAGKRIAIRTIAALAGTHDRIDRSLL
jgi:hypothetical protein